MRHRILINLSKEEVNPCIVMLTSLCENNAGHFDVLVHGEDIDDHCIDKLNKAMNEYDVTIGNQGSDIDEDVLELPVHVIIDGNIDAVLLGTGDCDVLVAAMAHDEGLTCNDIRGKYPVISYPEDKPWQSTNIHYDIEGIWWEYAKKTTVYYELMESFLESSLSNSFLEDYAIKICDENDRIKETINQTRETIGKLMG